MSSDMPEMSTPSSMPTDWTPATLAHMSGTTFAFTLDETGESVVAKFDSPMEVARFVGNTGPKFDYSPTAGAVRVGDAAVPLPKRPAERRECTYKECDRQAEGHNNHYIPVLRAMNQKHLWFPVEAVEQDGTKRTFRFRSAVGEETATGYNHNPEDLARAEEYNPEWAILRFKTEDRRYRAVMLSKRPLTPCTAAA